MKNILQNFGVFIKSLSLIDFLFFISIIILLILIVSLVYISKINGEFDVDNDNTGDDNMKDDEIDLVDITKKIGEEAPKPIKLTDYEKEQEEKAIISYDELLKTKTNVFEEVNYKEEKNVDGLKIRELDSNNATKKVEMPNDSLNNSEYKKEEDYLDDLKKLKKDLD